MRVSTTNFQNAFGRYLKLTMDSEEVIITKNGRAIAKLIQYEDPMVYVMKEGQGEYLIRRRVSYDEFVEITNTSKARYELIDGEIYLMASPNHKHQVIVRELLVQLHTFFKETSCSPITSPFDVRLSNGAESFVDDPNIVQPDLLVICDEENIDDKGVYHGVPTLVVEVLSPSTRNKDMLTKLSLYMKSGVAEYWIVDLENDHIHMYVFHEYSIKIMKTFMFGSEIISEFFPELSVVLK